MKKIIALSVFISFFFLSKAQNIYEENENYGSSFATETAFSAGFGLGGNSPFGVDMEVMLFPRFSAQMGLGLKGFSAGFNYHIYPTVSSPFISVITWQNGFAQDYKAMYAGGLFNYRASKIFQAGIGLGYAYLKNPSVTLKSPYMLLLNLGVYFPL